MLRAAGVPFDLRSSMPYSGYEKYEFDIPTQTAGDSFARYLVRIEEMRQSLRIIEQALKSLPEGPYQTDNRKMVPPPRQELDTSMEAVIHHFKLMDRRVHPAARRGNLSRRRRAAGAVGLLPAQRRQRAPVPPARARAVIRKPASYPHHG